MQQLTVEPEGNLGLYLSWTNDQCYWINPFFTLNLYFITHSAYNMQASKHQELNLILIQALLRHMGTLVGALWSQEKLHKSRSRKRTLTLQGKAKVQTRQLAETCRLAGDKHAELRLQDFSLMLPFSTWTLSVSTETRAHHVWRSRQH